MKTSSARRRSNSFDQPTLPFEDFDGSTPDAGAERSTATTASGPLEFPSFGNLQGVYAESSRRAGRVNAASVSRAEHEALLRERQRLLDKKFEGSISKSEANRLEYVRWSLDRIEDARHGQSLDTLEAYVSRYESLVSDINMLREQILTAIKG